jgi:hypothetical protein
MSASSIEKENFRRLVRSKVVETTQVCVREGVELALGRPSLNLIVAGELIRLGAAFAIKLGADEDGVANIARGCYQDAQALVQTRPAGLFPGSR